MVQVESYMCGKWCTSTPPCQSVERSVFMIRRKSAQGIGRYESLTSTRA